MTDETLPAQQFLDEAAKLLGWKSWPVARDSGFFTTLITDLARTLEENAILKERLAKYEPPEHPDDLLADEVLARHYDKTLSAQYARFAREKKYRDEDKWKIVRLAIRLVRDQGKGS